MGWTETASAVGSLSIPFAVLGLGYLGDRRLKAIENQQWRNQELMRARMEHYDTLAPMLNTLFCYFTYVGDWKEHEPRDVVALKRTLDRAFYIAAPLFSDEVQRAYDQLLSLCYQSYAGWGTDAKLRTDFHRRADAFGAGWDPSWEPAYADPADAVAPGAVATAYDDLLDALATDLGLPAGRRLVTRSEWVDQWQPPPA